MKKREGHFKVIDRFITYLMLRYIPELDIGLADRGELNFDQSFLQFNVKKKIYAKSSSRFDFKRWILDNASLSS